MNGPAGADRKFYMILLISFIFKTFFYDLGRLFEHTSHYKSIATRDDNFIVWGKKLEFWEVLIGCGS